MKLRGLQSFVGFALAIGALTACRPYGSSTVQVGNREPTYELLVPSETTARTHADVLRTVRRKVGMVFQQFNLFPHLTVVENLIEAPVHVLKERRDAAIPRAEKLLERVGLTARKDA